MILDALCKLSVAQQVTADAVSGNTYDAGNVTPKNKLGNGEPMGIMVAITAVGTNTGSAKLQAIMSAAANLGTPTIVGEIDLATADIAAGKVYIIPISAGDLAALRYWGANYDITGTVDFTVDAYLGPLSSFGAGRPETYAKGYAILQAMGYTDTLTLVARSLALTGTGSVSDSVDLGSTVRARDVAAGEPLGFLISVDVAATRTAAPGDDETYTFEIIESATGALGSPTVLSETTIDYATLVAGFQFILPVPIGLISKRYLGLNFVLAGTTPTITVTAGLKPLELADANPRPYASGFAIR